MRKITLRKISITQFSWALFNSEPAEHYHFRKLIAIRKLPLSVTYKPTKCILSLYFVPAMNGNKFRVFLYATLMLLLSVVRDVPYENSEHVGKMRAHRHVWNSGWLVGMTPDRALSKLMCIFFDTENNNYHLTIHDSSVLTHIILQLRLVIT